jgi:hypothetical protein
MNPHPLRVATEARDLDAMVDTLADDVVFRSPVISSPFHGRAEVRELFEIVLEHFHDLEYTGELAGEDTRGLLFSARVRGRPVQGIQVLHLDDQGKIRELRVMARPQAGLAAIADVVGGQLARHRRGGTARAAVVGMLSKPLLALTATIDAGAPRLAQARRRGRAGGAAARPGDARGA